MDIELSVGIIIGATLVLGGAMVGFFIGKKAGFGRFNSAVLVLMLVLYVATLAFAAQKMETISLVNLLFAVAGYAGGLLSGKNEDATNQSSTGGAASSR